MPDNDIMAARGLSVAVHMPIMDMIELGERVAGCHAKDLLGMVRLGDIPPGRNSLYVRGGLSGPRRRYDGVIVGMR